MQETLIDTLRKDNEHLVQNLRSLEMQNMQLMQENERDTKELKKKVAEVNRVRKQLRDKEKQMTKMALDRSIAARSKGGKVENSDYEEEIHAIIAEKDAMIEKLERIIGGYETPNVFFKND